MTETDLQELAKSLGCNSAAEETFRLVLQHDTVLASSPEAPELRAQVSLLTDLGKRFVNAACLIKLIADDDIRDLHVINRDAAELIRSASIAFAKNYRLVELCDFGGPNVDARVNFESIEVLLAARTIGALIAHSSFDHTWKCFREYLSVSSQSGPFHEIRDPKTCLQEITQGVYGKQPVYKLVSDSGPPHNKIFTVRVLLPNGEFAIGDGRSQSTAQVEAARRVLVEKKLLRLAPAIAAKFKNTSLPNEASPATSAGGRNSGRRPSPEAVRAAQSFGPRLGCPFLKAQHLAIALSANYVEGRTSYEINARLKMLGSALEAMFIQRFLRDALADRMIAANRLTGAQIEARLRSAEQYSELCSALQVDRYVVGLTQKASSQVQIEVLRSILAAVFLSVHSADKVYEWLKEGILRALGVRLDRLLAEPWRIREPKTLLQDLIQSTGRFSLHYDARRHGSPNDIEYEAGVGCIDGVSGAYVPIGRAKAPSKSQAEKLAALDALGQLVPSQGAELHPIVGAIWASSLETSTRRRTAVPQVGFLAHIAMLDSVKVFASLKALLDAAPHLAGIVSAPEYRSTIIRSCFSVSPFPIRRLQEITLAGIEMWTSISPEDYQQLLDSAKAEWLGQLRVIANAFKLPETPFCLPLRFVGSKDLELLRLRSLTVTVAAQQEIPVTMFSHVVSVLEGIDENLLRATTCNLSFQRFKNACEVTITIRSESLPPNAIDQIVATIRAQAFFSAVEDEVLESAELQQVRILALCPSFAGAHVRAYVTLLATIFSEFVAIQGMYRVVHDLKNQFISLQNYARTIERGTNNKFHLFAKISELQSEIRQRRIGVATLFRSTEAAVGDSCDLHRVVREFAARELFSLPAQIRVIFENSIDGEAVQASAEHIDSILTNLTRNAVEAMPGGGSLTISASYEKTKGVFRFRISDSGVGIAREMRANLFTGLRSTKRGMGIGLATVKQTVDRYDGRIAVESEVGEGTSFEVQLPLRPADSASEYA